MSKLFTHPEITKNWTFDTTVESWQLQDLVANVIFPSGTWSGLTGSNDQTGYVKTNTAGVLGAGLFSSGIWYIEGTWAGLFGIETLDDVKSIEVEDLNFALVRTSGSGTQQCIVGPCAIGQTLSPVQSITGSSTITATSGWNQVSLIDRVYVNDSLKDGGTTVQIQVPFHIQQVLGSGTYDFRLDTIQVKLNSYREIIEMTDPQKPKINVRANDAQGGALGEMNPVVGMTTMAPNSVTIQDVNADGTVVVTGNSAIGGAGVSGVCVNPEKLFIEVDMASGVLPNTLRGSWPTGVDVRLFNWSAKTHKTTTH